MSSILPRNRDFWANIAQNRQLFRIIMRKRLRKNIEGFILNSSKTGAAAKPVCFSNHANRLNLEENPVHQTGGYA
jgi:hypothetical protein